jgi:hypothetical protein
MAISRANMNQQITKPGKVRKVMREFKEGTLHSGKKGPVVKDRKQAIAIALSEARKKANGGMIEIEISAEPSERMMKDKGMKYAEGGSLKMVKKGDKEVPFFAADGKGKMKGGGMAYSKGGRIDGCAMRGKTKGSYR